MGQGGEKWRKAISRASTSLAGLGANGDAHGYWRPAILLADLVAANREA